MMVTSLSMIFIGHIFLFQTWKDGFTESHTEASKDILIAQLAVRIINLILEVYVAYFVVLHNFRFYLRKKYEKIRNLSLGD